MTRYCKLRAVVFALALAFATLALARGSSTADLRSAEPPACAKLVSLIGRLNKMRADIVDTIRNAVATGESLQCDFVD